MGWLIGIILGIVVLFFLFVRFTTVEEGTAKIIVRLGGVVKVFIQWSGYRLDRDGNVVGPGPIKRRLFGGLRVWLGLPVDKVYKYKMRWHSVEEVEKKRVPIFHIKEKTDFVMVRPDRYWRKTPSVETADGQFPDVEWLVGMRSLNPEKTIFKAPHDWVENALNQIEPTLRAYVRTKNLADLLSLNREQIWNNIGTDRAIQKVLKEEWGIQVDEEEIGIFAVDMPPEYQEALAAQARQELMARGRAAQTVGTVLAMLAQSRGKTLDEIRAEIDVSPEMRQEFLNLGKDLIIRQLGIEGQSYIDIRVQGAEGFERMLLNALAAWQRMPMGRGRSPEVEVVKKKSHEELVEQLRETEKKWKEDKK